MTKEAKMIATPRISAASTAAPEEIVEDTRKRKRRSQSPSPSSIETQKRSKTDTSGLSVQLPEDSQEPDVAQSFNLEEKWAIASYIKIERKVEKDRMVCLHPSRPRLTRNPSSYVKTSVAKTSILTMSMLLTSQGQSSRFHPSCNSSSPHGPQSRRRRPPQSGPQKQCIGRKASTTTNLLTSRVARPLASTVEENDSLTRFST